MVQAKLKSAISFLISLLLSAGLFVAINLPQEDPGCADCFAPHVRPFTYYHEGGYGGGAAYVWPGIAADIGVVLLAAFLIATGLNRTLARKRDQ